MTAMIVRRLGWAIVVMWFVVTATFVMTTLIPSDPAKALLGPHATPESVERLNQHYCLDRDWIGQYGCWLERVLDADLGESYRSKRPVTAIVADRVWPTAQLALAAIALQLLIGVPLGVIAAIRRDRWPDRVSQIGVLLALSAPTFVVGTVAVYVAAYWFGWFPINGYGEPGLDRLHHLVLPALTLAAGGIAYYARVIRTELVDALGEDFVRTARAKGLSERTVVLRHGLRTSLGPLVALIGLDLGVLLGGAIVTEAIFAWPGLGREVLQSIIALDLPLIVGTVIVSAIALAVAGLLVDLVCLGLDPRLRSGHGAGHRRG